MRLFREELTREGRMWTSNLWFIGIVLLLFVVAASRF